MPSKDSGKTSLPEGRAPYDHPGTRAIQRMVEFAPSTGSLALWVKHQAQPPEADAPIVSTDGNTLLYGRGFDALAIAEQIGLVAHEVLHIALRHPQRFLDLKALLGDVDLQLFNICADAIVNSALSHLNWLLLPRSAIYLDRLLTNTLGIDQTIEKSLLEWDVERLYRAIDDRHPRRGGGNDRSGPSETNGVSETQTLQSKPSEMRRDGLKSARARAMGAQIMMDLMPVPESHAPPEAEAEQTRLWSERIERGHAGDGEHSMLRTLLADLPRVHTPWEQILRAHLARYLSSKPGISWSRPTRSYLANQGRCGPRGRLPWEPGFSTSKLVPRLVVIVDVSGSIEDDLLERFALEIEAMTRRLEADLVLVIGDDCVRRVVRFEPGLSDLREIAFNGRGGTDFTPLLLEADKHRPDVAIVLTDLQGPAEFRPRWPVIWAVPETHDRTVQPFGRKLALC
jgi:predicted metal-dependent peptidase